ncbi:CLAVATA3/ESR (CLE)-related protein 12 [Platanthera zijinensis]|uniref:CLAVATA3/ESR (CLE)-related protein 12 n=1 Tax=Platanthera zijinensis TaxID=2320716 RepID=A0AAP0FVE8_9ASPA
MPNTFSLSLLCFCSLFLLSLLSLHQTHEFLLTFMALSRHNITALLLFLALLLPIPGWTQIRRPEASALPPANHRKLLSTQAHHHQHHHHSRRSHHHRHSRSAPSSADFKPNVTVGAGVDDGNEIDPRYGVEKRFVPCGPNPLHH